VDRELEQELTQFRQEVERFEAQLQSQELKLEDLALIRAHVRELLPRLAAAGRGVGAYSGEGTSPGTAAPLDGSAIAKVLLASRSSEEIGTLWSGGLVHTRHASVGELELDLDHVRLHGWAQNDRDTTGSAVAAPVKDAQGTVAAAIGLDLRGTGPTVSIDLHARAVLGAASRISAAMREHTMVA